MVNYFFFENINLLSDNFGELFCYRGKNVAYIRNFLGNNIIDRLYDRN
ncbi:hypothetical protein GGD38_006978 [Chitinophagaceae bacterium OAS944]|nr:hypothetical protein [Chitinophagaceae bacterium OAS944]